MIKLCKIKNVALRRSAVVVAFPMVFILYLIGAILASVAAVVIYFILFVYSVFISVIKSTNLAWKTDIIEYVSVLKRIINNSKEMMKSDFKPCNKTDE
jgi:hypothetical protein